MTLPVADRTAEASSRVCSAGRAESGFRGAGRSDWDTEDGRADPRVGSVSSCWLSWGLSEARACRAAKFETFPGAPGGTCQGAAGFAAGRRVTVGEGQAPGRGLGRPERGPCTACFRNGLSWEKLTFRSSDRTRCLPEKGGVAIPSAAQLRKLQGSARAELSTGRSLPARLP